MVRKISRDELREIVASGVRFKLVDVLGRESFEKEHIEGAISLPLDQIEARAAEALPDKGQRIITYCGGFKCQASTSAAEKLKALGYKDVLDYKGGLEDYKAANLPMEGCLFTEECLVGGRCCQ